MICSDVATLWRRSQTADGDSATWERVPLSGVRCEPMRGDASAVPGQTVSDGLTLFVLADVGIRPGDRVIDRQDGSQAPCGDAYRVTEVRRYSLGAILHHLEVTCR